MSLKEINPSLQEVKSAIRSMEQQLQTALKNIDARFEKIDARIDPLEKRIKSQFLTGENKLDDIPPSSSDTKMNDEFINQGSCKAPNAVVNPTFQRDEACVEFVESNSKLNATYLLFIILRLW